MVSMETSQRSFLAFLRPNNETVAVPESCVAYLGCRNNK